MQKSPIEIYLGYWFPLGINNVLLLGKKIYKIYLEFQKNPPKYFRGTNSPYRIGDEIIWNFFISVHHDESPNFELEVILKWHGSGFLICKSYFTKRQEGKKINKLIDVPSDVVRKSINVLMNILSNIFIKQLLPHQENYAKNVIFGKGLSYALNNYNPDLIDIKSFHKKLQSINQKDFLSGAEEKDILDGFNFLTFKIFTFESLDNVNLKEYDNDFINITNPISPNSLYIKGKTTLAYDLSHNTNDPKYIEKRGSIAISDDVANNSLINYLLSINSVLQFCSLLSYELIKIRNSLSKARQFLTKIDDPINLLSDFVEILEAKLPLYLELVSFIDIDAFSHIEILHGNSISELKKLEESDPYITIYKEKYNSYLDTLKRIRDSLREEIFALNKYLSIKTQQKYVKISQDAKSAATRSLDTQISLAEFQRSTIQKSRRTKWISSFAIAGAIASTQIYTKLSKILWNFIIKIQPFIVNILGGKVDKSLPTHTPDWFSSFLNITFTIFTAILLGKFIIYLESKIPDIIQYTFDLTGFEINSKVYNNFLKFKKVKTLREAESSLQIIWLEKILIYLDIKDDLIIPEGSIEKIFFKLKKKIFLRFGNNIKKVNRQAVCTLNCKLKFKDNKLNTVLLQNLTISVERNPLESSEAYIYPIHIHASKLLFDLLYEYDNENAINHILSITKSDVYKQYNRFGKYIEQYLEELKSNKKN